MILYVIADLHTHTHTHTLYPCLEEGGKGKEVIGKVHKGVYITGNKRLNKAITLLSFQPVLLNLVKFGKI